MEGQGFGRVETGNFGTFGRGLAAIMLNILIKSNLGNIWYVHTYISP